MDIIKNLTRPPFEAVSTSRLVWSVTFASAVALFLLYSRFRTADGPKALRDPIPHVYNTLQFMSNNHKFMARVQNTLQGSGLLRFYLGPKTVYLVAGSQAIRAMFGRELVHKVTNQEQMTRYALPTLYKMNRDEIKRWEDDKTGVAKIPIPGTENTPTRQRLWYTYEHIHTEYLGREQYTKPLVDAFSRTLGNVLERYPRGEWMTVNVEEFCRREVAESAVKAFFGPDLIKLSPDFMDRFWTFDSHVFKLVLGLPKWMNGIPFQSHDHYLAAIQKWLHAAEAGFDWESPEATAEWEPRFGARAPRELVKWMRETGWRSEVIAAAAGALVFALISNSIPTTTWMLMEIIKDPSLLQAVRDEVATVTSTDPETGSPSIDSRKLAALPLLQSIFTETLRLRINFNIMRDVKQPITLDGHTIPRGSLLQAPMQVAHYNEAVWGATGHPATDFWAERHVRTGDGSRRVYSMAGSSTSYFPFGGGTNMCPGRHLAKFEILTTIALVVSQFDIELVGWVNPDGSPSHRAAEGDLRFCGAGAMPPDREMKIRWRRRSRTSSNP